MHPTMDGWQDYRAIRDGRSVVGDLRVLRGVESPQLGVTRDVLALVPEAATSSGRRYPVLYMHDGQNLFDASTSFAGEWGVDETMAALRDEGIEAIVVGVPNGGVRRFPEYTPYPPEGDHRGPPVGEGEAYVRFLVETVKPLVDRAFPTRPDRGATGIMGSSLGGLISLWAAFEHANTFGFAGAMSPGIPPSQRPLFDLLRRPAARPDRIYVDVGGHEGHGAPGRLAEIRSRAFQRDVRRIRDALVEGGSRVNEDLLYVEEPDAIHHESAWARRLPGALRFLLGPLTVEPR